MSSPSWYPDPAHRHQLRWWDGVSWTDHVSDAGVAAVDPLGDTLLPSVAGTERTERTEHTEHTTRRLPQRRRVGRRHPRQGRPRSS
ncbi:MAG: DUF2510 domain-containing protein [Ilumatobacteraceae bacterium]